LNIGLTGGSDTSNVRTIGPQITLELPVFDRNQGNRSRSSGATRAQSCVPSSMPACPADGK